MRQTSELLQCHRQIPACIWCPSMRSDAKGCVQIRRNGAPMVLFPFWRRVHSSMSVRRYSLGTNGQEHGNPYSQLLTTSQWPEASLYLPALLSSVIRNAEPEGLVGRVDYCWTPLCTGEEISRHDRAQIPDNIQIGRTGREDSELLKEEMCAWWLGFTCRL